MNKEEAMKILKDFHDKSALFSVRTALDTIIPELRESEDEKIKNRLIKLIKMSSEVGGFALHKWEADELLAWLEKQGEQKPINKVVPKFQNGQWIVWKNKYYKVNDNGCGYELIDQNGLSTSLEYGTVDKSAHLWDVSKDAKDGDVLSNGEIILIFKHFEEPSYRQHIVAYIGLDRGGDIQITDGTWKLGIDKAKPATKEQRDTLLKAMAEAGYEWSEETHKLKKISQRMVSAEAKEALYDKPTDEEMKELLRTEYEKGRADTLSEMKSSWSKEDEAGLGDALWAIKQARTIAKDENDMGNLWYAENWLNSIKNRIQPKQKWSEEDESIVLGIEQLCNCASFLNIAPDKIDKIRTWLKSLRPQNRWKPSEEQMDALNDVISSRDIKYDVLSELWKDLAKL